MVTSERTRDESGPPGLLQPPGALRRLRGLVLDFAYPPRCGGCDRRGTVFCDECRASLIPPGPLSSTPSSIDQLVSAGRFQGPLRRAIHNFKYESDARLAVPLAGLVVDILVESGLFFAAFPVIVPVPLHDERRRERGYNQAERLARELAIWTGWRLSTGLVRTRKTRSQVGLGAAERRENVQGAFEWRPASAPSEVLLVDDVCTTGSTLSECAVVLRAAGARVVCAATVARALDPSDDLAV